MSDQAPVVGLPPLAQSIVRAVLQKGLAALAATLTTYGAISTDQQTAFVSLMLSIVLWAVSFAWTYVQEKTAHITLATAINAPAPTPPVKP
jgi:hypothetical protein